MKKIAFLYFSMNTIFINILNNLNSKNKIYFLTSNLNYLNPNKNIKKIEIKNGFNLFNKFIFRKNLIKNLNIINPEIIFVTDIYWAEFFQALYYKFKNPKVNLILYSEVQRFPKNVFEKILSLFLFLLFKYILSKKVSKIICFTKDGVKFYKNLLKMRKKDIYLIPPVINTDLFIPLKKRTYLNNNILNLLIIARLISYKNYFDLLKALKYLKEKKNFNNFKLNILGDGLLKNKILKKIKKYNLEKNVIFLKKVSNDKIKYYYYENDILILPSFNEAIGMVVPESMSCGTPCIISDTVGAKTYIKNNENGLIFKTGDHIDLSNKILELNNRIKLKKFGKKSIINIKKNYSLKNIENIFKKVL